MTDKQAREFGVYIKDMRMARSWGTRQLATLANVDASVVTHLESGKARKPQVNTLRDLASAFDVPLVELFTASGYTTSCQAPCIEAHLRLCYSHLPEEALAQIIAFTDQTIAAVSKLKHQEAMNENQV